MNTLEFWELSRPNYASDYNDSLINGILEHPFGLPGVECPVCGDTWAGSRILPFQCPETLRKRKELRDRWPITLDAHKSLQQLVLAELRERGVELDSLRPGDSFQPCYLDVPSCPRADFLWSSIGSVVVSHRVKRLLDGHKIADVAFSEVLMRRVGKREVDLPAPIPSTGEPEALIDVVPLLGDTSSVRHYYEMIVLRESGYPPGGTPKSICIGCGRPDVDDGTRKIMMTPEMWKGDMIFFLATTLYIIVTNGVKELVEGIQPTNVSFMKM